MFGHGVRKPVRVCVAKNNRIAFSPLHFQSRGDEAGFSALIILIQINERGQESLILRGSNKVQMIAILLAGAIAQELERLALLGVRATDCCEAAIERMDGRILDQPVDR